MCVPLVVDAQDRDHDVPFADRRPASDCVDDCARHRPEWAVAVGHVHLPNSFRHTSAARETRLMLPPSVMQASVFIEHGVTTISIAVNDPEEIAAPRLASSC